MKQLTWIAVLAASGTALFAQDIAGNWQATLQNGSQKSRIIFKISKVEPGWKAVLYNLDEGAQGMACTAVLQGSTLKIAVPGIAAKYEASLNPDGNGLTGTWTSLSGAQSLDLKRARTTTAWSIPSPPRLKSMPANASPAFEVASIKMARPGIQGKGIGISGRQFSTANTSLSDLITWAYRVNARQIIGGPPWIEGEKYDLVAKPEGEGQPNEKQWKGMIQKLLADRFKLTFHAGKKELPVYAIVAGKIEPKLNAA